MDDTINLAAKAAPGPHRVETKPRQHYAAIKAWNTMRNREATPPLNEHAQDIIEALGPYKALDLAAAICSIVAQGKTKTRKRKATN